jgi:predicted transcriptional regulator of viral defense system
MNKSKKIVQELPKEKSIITTKELVEIGYSMYFIKKMQEEGYLLKVKRGVYSIVSNSESQYAEVKAIVSKGVLCLLSAAYLHNLTTFIPKNYQLAISNKSKIVLPEYPPIKLYFWSKKRYELGITTQEVEGIEMNIYNKEKTICDIIKYRNKIGLDTVKEILKNYLKQSDRNLTQLNLYAKELGNEKIITTYISLLI